jgi:hypothetical protein
MERTQQLRISCLLGLITRGFGVDIIFAILGTILVKRSTASA